MISNKFFDNLTEHLLVCYRPIKWNEPLSLPVPIATLDQGLEDDFQLLPGMSPTIILSIFNLLSHVEVFFFLLFAYLIISSILFDLYL